MKSEADCFLGLEAGHGDMDLSKLCEIVEDRGPWPAVRGAAESDTAERLNSKWWQETSVLLEI